MCGICGVFTLDGGLNPLRSSIGAMAAALAHRGPDGQGVFSDDVAAIAHRRLAIIDRAGGRQPMSNEDGTCWVVFNGEIYNHRLLRRQLIDRGHVFRTAADTEAILHAYEEYGTACVARLEGMFAFAVYDARRRELLVARDRLGKKPLYYAVLQGALHFASEIKALRRSPAWDGELDTSELEGFLSLGYVLAPNTIYRRVKKLMPGHWLRVRDGRIAIGQYWDVERFDDLTTSGMALEEQIDAALRTAVADRLESEVPLGAFLSGGIDSGLVVSCMADAIGPGVTTTSIGFNDAAHGLSSGSGARAQSTGDELAAARLTASRFATRHYEHVVQPALDGVLDRVVAAFDEPFADPSAIPTFEVSRLARSHVTVALSGDGGDETFGGYSFRYVPHAVEAAVRRLLPRRARTPLGWLGERWPAAPSWPRPLRCGTVLENLARDAAAAYYADLCIIKPHHTRLLLGRDPDRRPTESAVYAAVTDPYRRCASPSAVQRAQYADLKVYLANDVLVKVDRMSMQHGLEVRCPLLDHRIVELAFRIPVGRKMPRLRSKHLLRQIAKRRLPPAVARLPKRGFSVPLSAWMAGPCAAAFRDEVLTGASRVADLVDVSYVARLFAAHREGRADHGQALWAVWMLSRWYVSHMDSTSAVTPTAGRVGHLAIVS
jgi:asparagine synthase (glutamine-hydrolysing)